MTTKETLFYNKVKRVGESLLYQSIKLTPSSFSIRGIPDAYFYKPGTSFGFWVELKVYPRTITENQKVKILSLPNAFCIQERDGIYSIPLYSNNIKEIIPASSSLFEIFKKITNLIGDKNV